MASMELTEAVTFWCDYGDGFSPAVSAHRDHVAVQKKAQEVQVAFATDATPIDTLEGWVQADRGDAIITGAQGERWPVARERFLSKYEAVAPTVAGRDGVYRSRPRRLVALKMSGQFCVRLPDGISELRGSSGDWLVDYGDGSLGIVAASIFVDSYDLIP
jgi:hypothetical protein